MTAWQMVWDEGRAVQLHLLTVLPAFAIGTWLIVAARKGPPPHRRLGMPGRPRHRMFFG